jgi:hypothetical protein
LREELEVKLLRLTRPMIPLFILSEFFTLLAC